MEYQARSWDKPRRVIAKIEWRLGELFPSCYFIVTNSRLTALSVVKVYNGRGDVENRIKEGKNTLRWDKTSCHRFTANEARLKMGFIAYNLLHLIRRFYVRNEKARRSIEWIIMRLVKVAQEYPIMLGIGMFISHRLLRYVTITGLHSVGRLERAYF